MRYIIVERNGALKLVGVKGFLPDDYEADAPVDELTGQYEDPVWLQIEEIEDPEHPGQFKKVATVDEVLKAQTLAERETEKTEKDLEKETSKAELKAIKKKLTQLKKADLVNAENIKQTIMDIVQLLLMLETNLTNTDTSDGGKKD